MISNLVLTFLLFHIFSVCKYSIGVNCLWRPLVYINTFFAYVFSVYGLLSSPRERCAMWNAISLVQVLNLCHISIYYAGTPWAFPECICTFFSRTLGEFNVCERAFDTIHKWVFNSVCICLCECSWALFNVFNLWIFSFIWSNE